MHLKSKRARMFFNFLYTSPQHQPTMTLCILGAYVLNCRSDAFTALAISPCLVTLNLLGLQAPSQVREIDTSPHSSQLRKTYLTVRHSCSAFAPIVEANSDDSPRIINISMFEATFGVDERYLLWYFSSSSRKLLNDPKSTKTLYFKAALSNTKYFLNFISSEKYTV